MIMNANEMNNKLLGDIVANDFRSAEIFKEAGIDFCCGGKKTLAEACKEKGLNINEVADRLKKIQEEPASPGQNFKEWSLDFLSDYIVNTHHNYVRRTMPDLLFYTAKIASVHGENHPELKEVADLFIQIEAELTQHMKMEEDVLFPAIKTALRGNSSDVKERIHSEITRMSGEHEFAGGAMDKINEITGNYKVPADGCNTYNVTFKLLRQFEDDLHVHVHLENNILFPKALAL